MLLFPEGTRSPDNQINPFKDGESSVPNCHDGSERKDRRAVWYDKNRAQ